MTSPSNPGIRVGIIGVGNCASSLVQGISYYGRSQHGSNCLGLAHPVIGGLTPGHIQFTSAFDVNPHKIGRDLSEAIFVEPNNTLRFSEVPPIGTRVMAGPVLDGVGSRYREVIQPLSGDGQAVEDAIHSSGTEILVNYLPVGSREATEWWVEMALRTGCAFVNCIPVFIASRGDWAERFREQKLPLIGDDIKSQVGATALHRTLVQAVTQRGGHLDSTYQLNVGGNMDFYNMLNDERLGDKRQSKTSAVKNASGEKAVTSQIHVSPTDYISFLTDQKIAYLHLEGRNFGGAPFNLEVRLQVWDSPNSAGIVVDAVRCAKCALLRKEGGVLREPAAYMMKSPPESFPEDVASRQMEAYVADLNRSFPTESN